MFIKYKYGFQQNKYSAGWWQIFSYPFNQSWYNMYAFHRIQGIYAWSFKKNNLMTNITKASSAKVLENWIERFYRLATIIFWNIEPKKTSAFYFSNQFI